MRISNQTIHNLPIPDSRITVLQVRTLLKITALIIPLSLLWGCTSTGDSDEEPYKSWPAEKLYKEAKREIKDGDYSLAIDYLETLESRYPFGKLADQAQLDTAYAYFKFQEYDSAIAATERFIKLHPSHPNVDYAYYLRGLAAFHKKDTPFDSISPQDPAERDPSSTRNSFNYFAELVKKFPKSKYVPDAIERMKFQRNTLANHELIIASYYMKRGAYVAAVNRAKYVVENYPKTPAVPDALVLLTEAYNHLEMKDLANDTKRVLDHNFPGYTKPTVENEEDQ